MEDEGCVGRKASEVGVDASGAEVRDEGGPTVG